MGLTTAYPSIRRFGGFSGPETTPGTPQTMTFTQPFEKFDWEDKPQWLPDKGLRGVMADDAFDLIQGTMIGEVDLGGAAYLDVMGFPLNNIFGDQVVSGTYTGSGTGTLSASSAVGATSIQTSVSIPSGTLIQIDTGNLSECVTTSGAPVGTTAPYTIPVPALKNAHASAVTVQPVQAPFTYKFSLLNSATGQPPQHTLTQYYGLTTTSGARQFAGAAFSELGFQYNVESELLKWTGKATAWASNPAGAQPTASTTETDPLASWRVLVGVGGPASGGTQVMNVEAGEFTITRAVKPFFASMGSQNPYIIFRAGLTMTGKATFIAADETTYNNMRNNSKPQLQVVLNNQLTGANELGVQFDLQKAAFKVAKPNFGKEAIEFDAEFQGLLNTTNVGASGGEGPGTVTLINAVPPGTY